ncbi:hypothetical protein V865_008542 [Kwoniella europaea PYCC6329]|uniref:Uncharacterized protein n=1 Tax=Kwoniella europaea PYCC6329 TaxID=1423913 RepID=A0AAX4KVD0_9TREE
MLSCFSDTKSTSYSQPVDPSAPRDSFAGSTNNDTIFIVERTRYRMTKALTGDGNNQELIITHEDGETAIDKKTAEILLQSAQAPYSSDGATFAIREKLFKTVYSQVEHLPDDPNWP